jgi:hypothetical protein
VKKFSPFIFALVFCALPFALRAQLQLVTNSEPQSAFFGAAKNISVTFHNSGNQDFEHGIHTRIFQASSATAVLLSENPWKQIQVPAGETVLEAAALDFPAVKAKTKFIVQWLEDTNHVLGVTPVLIYPTNLFQALQSFLCETNFGVLDPGNQLKPLLKAQEIKFTDLAETELDDFSGQLAVIGPFQSQAQVPDGLADRILALAKKNVAVVWIQLIEPARGDARLTRLVPSFYCVQKKQTAVVVVQPELVYGLPENPQSQLNLIYFCKLALQPETFQLPNLTTQP